ncbi:hypothetical protein [Nocardioides sp. Soil805]|uniref:hypothetical protein n=1 Tax=Nocardioides sp. Soil805 TaxID=1736416 RepID=UPI0007026AD6|nr:hypothetical protein [Nocardioides sp. Soil805]KRF35020.1 hypothetical protein ASG94_12875 [Nocardioides sp. Soil805]
MAGSLSGLDVVRLRGPARHRRLDERSGGHEVLVLVVVVVLVRLRGLALEVVEAVVEALLLLARPGLDLDADLAERLLVRRQVDVGEPVQAAVRVDPGSPS